MTEARWSLLSVALVAPSAWVLDRRIDKFIPEYFSMIAAVVVSAVFWLMVIVLGMIAWHRLAR